MSTTSTTAAKAENSIGQVQFLTITALFIALTYVFTAFVNVRLPITANGGLIHLGNVPLFICAILFGKKSGALAGGIGMGLFDLLSGWTAWAPFTFVIVAIMGYVVGAACGKTREELTSALERQPIDEDNARALLLQLAAEQYDAIGNTEYETVRLRRLLTGRMPMPELDAELLQSAVSKVRVTNNCVTVTLKNGQTIERRDQL